MCSSDLTAESLGIDFPARIRRKNLDDDAARQRGIRHEVHVRHTSATELTLDDERWTQCGLEAGGDVRRNAHDMRLRYSKFRRALAIESAEPSCST